MEVAEEEFNAVGDSLIKVGNLSCQIYVNDLHRASMRRRDRWVPSHLERARRMQSVIARRLKGGRCERRIRRAAGREGSSERKRHEKGEEA